MGYLGVRWGVSAWILLCTTQAAEPGADLSFPPLLMFLSQVHGDGFQGQNCTCDSHLT